MKKLQFLSSLCIVVLMLVATSACQKETVETSNSTSNYSDYSGNKGDAIFWTSNASDRIDVTLNGVTKVITHKFTVAPSCGTSGCATFPDVEIGTYHYTAKNTYNVWNGTITIKAGICTHMELEQKNAKKITHTKE